MTGTGTYDPWAVVNLVMTDLARQGVADSFDTEGFTDAARAAADLLTALESHQSHWTKPSSHLAGPLRVGAWRS
jgi:hypothetical protein